jgi:hypothetical protein
MLILMLRQCHAFAGPKKTMTATASQKSRDAKEAANTPILLDDPLTEVFDCLLMLACFLLFL